MDERAFSKKGWIKMITILDLKKAKEEHRKLTMITCYDYAFAKLIDQTDIDLVLVGDSVAMVMHGYDSTIHATVEMIELHTKAVSKGLKKAFIVSDMPFLSLSKGSDLAIDSAGKLMRAGAHSVKIENIRGFESIVRLMVQTGIPVMGHLGLTPQSVHVFGGMKVQAKTELARKQLLEDAKLFEACGAFALVLECVPSDIAKEVTESISIPVIGIGAGKDTDGQVLVLQDLLGFQKEFKPKFLKHYLKGDEVIKTAIESYINEVKEGIYPDLEHSYGGIPAGNS